MENKLSCVKLSVQPSRALVDEKFVVQVRNVPPSFKLTLHAFHRCEKGHKWEAFGHYTADFSGTVNVAEDLCLGGTYSGVEPMGLLWSLRPVQGSKTGIYFMKRNAQTPMEVQISVYDGHRTDGFMDQEPLASVDVERWFVVPGVRRFPITVDGINATLFLPPGPGPFPGILDLWGLTGGLIEFRAALFASHGFACLTTNHMSSFFSGGKAVNYDFFETACGVLQQHPQILADRIAIFGSCVGGGIALRMAAYSEVLKLRCIVGLSACHVMPVNGSFEDRIHYFYNGIVRYTEDKLAILQDVFMGPRANSIPTDPTLKVDAGRFQCPVLLVMGEDDAGVPSYDCAMDMKEMMERSGNVHLLNVQLYPGTGHVIQPPYFPHERVSAFTAFGAEIGSVLWGGESAAHCHAQEDSWGKILDFLRANLCGSEARHAALLSRL